MGRSVRAPQPIALYAMSPDHSPAAQWCDAYVERRDDGRCYVTPCEREVPEHIAAVNVLGDWTALTLESGDAVLARSEEWLRATRSLTGAVTPAE